MYQTITLRLYSFKYSNLHCLKCARSEDDAAYKRYVRSCIRRLVGPSSAATRESVRAHLQQQQISSHGERWDTVAHCQVAVARVDKPV